MKNILTKAACEAGDVVVVRHWRLSWPSYSGYTDFQQMPEFERGTIIKIARAEDEDKALVELPDFSRKWFKRQDYRKSRLKKGPVREGEKWGYE